MYEDRTSSIERLHGLKVLGAAIDLPKRPLPAKRCVDRENEACGGVSEVDRDAPWCRGREQVVLGPARAAASYLDIERVVLAARESRCSALHPGWGFLAENPRFASLCAAHGVTFIGHPRT